MSDDVHPLIEKIVEIEWIGAEPELLRDSVARERHDKGSFKVLQIRDGMILIQRDVSRVPHGPGFQYEVWVPFCKIAGIRVHAGR
jgi:hypothetical protein